jgi:hypothetical protein
VVLLKLVKVSVIPLSQLFLPASSLHGYWDVTHDHIPPTTFSGFVLRAILSVDGLKNLAGEYTPHKVNEGLLVRIKRIDGRMVCDWHIARREEVIEDFKPPYLEYHFKAISLGVYPGPLLRSKQPNVGVVDKYWNVLKYIDNVELVLKLGVKTWHYVVVGDGEKYHYDVVKVKHKVFSDPLYGFILVNDRVLENYLEKLMMGWFIYRLGVKNLVAMRVEELMNEVGGDVVDYVLPFLSMPNKVLCSFTTALLDINALKGLRKDASVIKGYLHVSSDPVDELGKLILFRDKEYNIYGVDREWLRYLV